MVAQGKRGGGGGSKKTPIPQLESLDDSYIVFSNAKGDAKSKKASSNAFTSKDGVIGNPTVEDVPKKPDTRKLIGGASWTGKLPVNLLSEHCQKQKWQKPEYTMVCHTNYCRSLN